MKYQKLRFTLKCIRWSIAAYVALRIFCFLALPDYYTAHTTNVIEKVHRPKTPAEMVERRRPLPSLGTVEVSPANFSRISEGQFVTFRFDQKNMVLTQTAARNDIGFVTKIPIYPRNLPEGTKIINVWLSDSGFAHYNLESSITWFDWILCALTPVCVLFLGLMAAWGIQIVSSVVLVIFVALATGVWNALTKKNHRPDFSMADAFLPGFCSR